MNRPELYHKTIDLLKDAYFKDELRHADCRACVVGNICKPHAEDIGIEDEKWANKFLTFTINGKTKQVIAGKDEMVRQHCFGNILISVGSYPMSKEIKAISSKIDQMIAATGYTMIELAAIEYAFETAEGYMPTMTDEEAMVDDTWMFNGLMAVIDVLDEIHEVEDRNITVSSKSKFLRSEMVI